MEVVRPHLYAVVGQRRKPRRLYVDHAVLILQCPFYKKKPAARHHQAVALVHVRRHDHVGDSRFVFHGDEDESLRRSWATSYTDQEGRNTQVQYDGVGNRTQLMWPAGTNGSGAYYVTYQYDAMNRMTEIDQNGSMSTPLAKYQWDLLSRQTLITYGDGTTDSYSQYDAADNLQTLTQTYAAADNSVTFSYTWQKNHQRASVGVSDGAF